MATKKVNHKGIKNLVPWSPGTSGNPSGRPRGTVQFATRMRDAFNEAPAGQKHSLTDVIIKMAFNEKEPDRQQWAIQFMAAYGIGLPKRELDDESARKLAREMFEEALRESRRRKASELQASAAGNETSDGAT